MIRDRMDRILAAHPTSRFSLAWYRQNACASLMHPLDVLVVLVQIFERCEAARIAKPDATFTVARRQHLFFAVHVLSCATGIKALCKCND